LVRNPAEWKTSVSNNKSVKDLPEADISRVIEMAWEDRTPFDAVAAAYGFTEADVIALMRARLKRSGFKMWRERVRGRQTKHALHAPASVTRHKADNRRHRGI
jgi:uncharacterized protein (TIGR03643 family)